MPVILKDVAAAAEVSIPTANQILNGHTDRFTPETVAKVLAAASRTGYRKNIAASGLRDRRSYLVGVLFLSGNYLYYDEFMYGVQQRLLEGGFAPIFLSYASFDDQCRTLELCLQRNVEGLLFNTIVGNSGPMLPEPMKQLLDENFPIVEVLGHFIPGIPHFEPDYYGMSHEITMELLGRGCRRIVHVNHENFPLSATRPEGCWNAWDCWNGYRTAMTDAGLEPVTVRHSLEHYLAAPGSFFVDAAAITEKVLKYHPDAVTFFNEEELLAFSQHPEVKKRIDNGLLQLGFIDSERGSYQRKPDWVRRGRPMTQLGYRAADQLLNVISQ